jgi:diaminopropionate ammonia-lyase
MVSPMNAMPIKPIRHDIWLPRDTPRPEHLNAVAEAVLPVGRRHSAQQHIRNWPGYSVTPLVALPGLADWLRLSAIWCKDEGGRFGIGSFKALGGAYAVVEQLQANEATRAITCATEGNHGRAVAWAAQRHGVRCIIYLHAGVSEARERAIVAYAAEIRRVTGNYDDAVRVCAAESKKNGWTVVSDTSWPGYEEIPRSVMAGYTVITREIVDQMEGRPAPTHVFLQGGVGGLAAAVMSDLSTDLPIDRTRYIIVEPTEAACLLESLRADKPSKARGTLRTVMAGLACGEPSPIALQIVRAGAAGAITITDEHVGQAVRLFGTGTAADRRIVSGPSGAAGLGGLIAAGSNGALASAFGLDRESRVLVINTESDTDAAAYRRIMEATDR